MVAPNKNLEKPLTWFSTTVLFILAIFLFLLAIDLVGASVTMIGQETARSILLATSNPFIGLFIGLLATALIQSSSTVTSMTVAVVASGYLTLENAIPVVMGANVGTTLTSTLVSLGYITNSNQFRKAISAGSIHDFFNIITALVLFPLEYYYGTLSKLAIRLTAAVDSIGSGDNVVNDFSIKGISFIGDWIVNILPQNFLSVIISLLLLFLSIKFLSKIIYKLLIGSSKNRMKKYVFDNPFKSFGWGVLVTAGVQSSSITTSLSVPMVASGKVSLERSFPFILGANIGTTITALLAAINKTDAAISLALVHLLFNLVGVLIFLPFPLIRRIPVVLATRFGAVARNSRIAGLSYIVFTFFLLPFALISFNRGYVSERTYLFELQESGETSYSTIKVKRQASDNLLSFHVYDEEVVDLNDVPDTIMVVDAGAEKFVTSQLVYNVNSDTPPLASYQILSRNDTASYVNENLRLERINYIEIRFSDGREGHFWYDQNQKIVIQSKFYDVLGGLISSSNLVSIQ